MAQAAALSKLNDPGLLKVIGCEHGSDGFIWIDEYVEGQMLDTYLAKKGKINWQQALRFSRQLLSGLEHLHNAKMLHEAMSPENIFISRGNTAKFMHVGLAHIISKNSYLSHDEKGINRYEWYRAPEALSDIETPTSSADIYSLGLIAYEMVTGRGPMKVNHLAMGDRAAAIATPLPLLSTVNPSVSEVFSDTIAKALEKHPIHRFQRAGLMSEALQEIPVGMAHPSVNYDQAPYLEHIKQSFSFRRIILFIAIAALAVAGFFLIRMNQKNPFEALTMSEPLPGQQAAGGVVPVNDPGSKAVEIPPIANAEVLPVEPDTLFAADSVQP